MMMIMMIVITISILIIVIIITIMNIIKTYVSECPFRLLLAKLSRGPLHNFTEFMLYTTELFLYFCA